MINKIIESIPSYPFWLENLKQKETNEVFYKCPKGVCLEVGCGNTTVKEMVLLKNKNVSDYIATEYEVTHSITDNKYKKVDDYADALNLKYDDESFDTYIAFEVLEHMPDYYKFFKEAGRVLRQNGTMIFTVPFLYREHGSPVYHEDYFRFTKNSFEIIAKKFGFRCKYIYSNTGVGTTVAVLINTYVIRKIFESKFKRYMYLLISPFVFFITNVIGLIIDMKPDDRYATRYLVIFEKI